MKKVILGKTGLQVKAHLVTKNAARAGAGAVAFFRAMKIDMAHQIFVGVGDSRGH